MFTDNTSVFGTPISFDNEARKSFKQKKNGFKFLHQLPFLQSGGSVLFVVCLFWSAVSKDAKKVIRINFCTHGHGRQLYHKKTYLPCNYWSSLWQSPFFLINIWIWRRHSYFLLLPTEVTLLLMWAYVDTRLYVGACKGLTRVALCQWTVKRKKAQSSGLRNVVIF